MMKLNAVLLAFIPWIVTLIFYLSEDITFREALLYISPVLWFLTPFITLGAIYITYVEGV